jgi:hypothetical protein
MSDYCVGNCLGWDDISGKLTIATDPLGGTTCGTDGLKVKIAGNTTGIAASPKNNGLFMTSAGELASKVNPQRRILTGVSGSQSIMAYAANGDYSYALTPTMTVSNPSVNYPMLAVLEFSWYYNFQVFGDLGSGSWVGVTGTTIINGAYANVTYVRYDTFDEGNMTIGTYNTYKLYQEIAPGASMTFLGRQTWNANGTGGQQPYFFTASSSINGFGLIMETV